MCPRPWSEPHPWSEPRAWTQALAWVWWGSCSLKPTLRESCQDEHHHHDEHQDRYRRRHFTGSPHFHVPARKQKLPNGYSRPSDLALQGQTRPSGTGSSQKYVRPSGSSQKYQRPSQDYARPGPPYNDPESNEVKSFPQRVEFFVCTRWRITIWPVSRNTLGTVAKNLRFGSTLLIL